MNVLKKKVKPGDLLSEYDVIGERFLGKYIILDMDNFEFDAYCLYDITGYFSQGTVISIGHDEIRNTRRYIWTVEDKDGTKESNKAKYHSSTDAASP